MYQLKRSGFAFFGFVLIGGIAALMPHTGFGQAGDKSGAMRHDCLERPCAGAVARGRAAFNEPILKSLGGNGRSCADCHMPSESFQLSPAFARARFDALQEERKHNPNADDPLFRPADADDFRINGDNAVDFSNLVENGLVRVTMPLPLNVKLIDPVTGQPTGETEVDLWRAVMPVLNIAITGPDGVAPIWPPGAPRLPIMGQDPNGPEPAGRLPARCAFRFASGASSRRTLRARASICGATGAHARRSSGLPGDVVLIARSRRAGFARSYPAQRSSRIQTLSSTSLSSRARWSSTAPAPSVMAAHCIRVGQRPTRRSQAFASSRAISTYLQIVRARPQTVTHHVRSVWRATRGRIASPSTTTASSSSRLQIQDDCFSRANFLTWARWTSPNYAE